ncbi:MAG TPA: purine/pyrimidine permease [Firmicutes bacterium]|nr:purine/pyrimidine permease [Bacillota bacterium]
MSKTQLKNDERPLIYHLNDRPPFQEMLAYAMQWLLFTIGPVISTAIVIGQALGLGPGEVASFLQRLLIISGVGCLAQVTLGHRLPILEAAAAFSWGYILFLVQRASALGLPISKLRTDVEGGLVVAGIVVAAIVVLGLAPALVRLFTPIVTSVVIIMAVIQVAQPLVTSMIRRSDGIFDPMYMAVSVIVLGIVYGLSLSKRRALRSVSVVSGLAVGWLLSMPLGLTRTDIPAFPPASMFFSWGPPTFDTVAVITLTAGYVMFIANTIASMKAVEAAVKLPSGSERTWSRGILVNGLVQSLSGLMAGAGTVSYPASAAIIDMTGVAARAPFVLFSIILVALGFARPVIALVATMPASVASAATFAAVCNMFVVAIKGLAKVDITPRRAIVIGCSVVAGIGFGQMALLAGSVICILLENLLRCD